MVLISKYYKHNVNMSDKLTNSLGKRIKELRKKANLTQDKFSEFLGIDSKHLSRIECGKNQPSLSLIKKISTILNIEIAQLFEVSHLDNKKAIIGNINSILNESNEEEVRLFYKILKSIKN